MDFGILVRMLRLRLLALCVAPVLHANVVSMSSADLVVEGQRGSYELRMPMYELTHVANPETALFEHIQFKGAERKSGACHEDSGYFVCNAIYEFARPIPDKVDAICTLFQVTVPNHVHLLHATQGKNGDQVVFDQRFTDVEVRFRPPSAAEKFVRDAAAGMSRLWYSVSGLVFLITLALAARNTNERMLFGTIFIVAEWIAQPLAPVLPLALSSGFLEAAMALTGAYLAVDLLLLPEARLRVIMVPFFGLVHGLYFASFPVHYLTGACVEQIVALVFFGVLAAKLGRWPRLAGLVLTLVASLGWFVKLMVSGGKA